MSSPGPGVGADPPGGVGPLFDRSVLTGPAPDAARALLGALLVCRPAAPAGRPEVPAGSDEQVVVLRLTEVEAYAGPGDPASHAARGRTPRTAVMFGAAGHAYVYRSYGLHWCLNVTCGPDGTASAALVRAAAVVGGLATARARRPTVTDDARLARGPGVLTLAAGITGALYGADLCDPTCPVTLHGGSPPVPVATGPRVGVSGAADVPWRFWVPGEPSVSAYRRSPAAPRPS